MKICLVEFIVDGKNGRRKEVRDARPQAKRKRTLDNHVGEYVSEKIVWGKKNALGLIAVAVTTDRNCVVIGHLKFARFLESACCAAGDLQVSFGIVKCLKEVLRQVITPMLSSDGERQGRREWYR